MRITNGMIVNSFLSNLQTSLSKMDKYTAQLSSGRKIVRLSDDPVGVFTSLTARHRLATYEQYQRNLITARNWAEVCESSLQDVSSKLTAIKEEVINAATNIKNDGDRENISVLMHELRNTVKDALNSVVGDQYIFAGYNTSNPPLTIAADGKTILYNGLDISDMANAAAIEAESKQNVELEVGYDLFRPISMTAIDVLGAGDNNFFKTVNDIIDLMQTPSSNEDVVTKLSGYLGKLDKAHENITSCLVKIGATTTQLEILDARYAEDVINYNEIRSKIEDIDSAETIMDWKMADAVYKQSLSAGARVIMPTLLDFLR